MGKVWGTTMTPSPWCLALAHPGPLTPHPAAPHPSAPHPSPWSPHPSSSLTLVPCAVQRSTLHAVGQKLRMLKARYRQPLPTARSEQSARQRSVHEGP